MWELRTGQPNIPLTAIAKFRQWTLSPISTPPSHTHTLVTFILKNIPVNKRNIYQSLPNLLQLFGSTCMHEYGHEYNCGQSESINCQGNFAMFCFREPRASLLLISYPGELCADVKWNCVVGWHLVLAPPSEQPCRTIVTQTWYFQGQGGSGWHILWGLRNGCHVSQDLYNQCKGQSIKCAQRNLKQQY